MRIYYNELIMAFVTEGNTVEICFNANRNILQNMGECKWQKLKEILLIKHLCLLLYGKKEISE